MRKLKLQLQVTVDGFISGPEGEMDWMIWKWDDALKNYVQKITDPVDCILLGRKFAQGFIPYWASKPPDENEWMIEKINMTHKVVFSMTLKTNPWENTSLANEDLVTEIANLKEAQGGDMIVYGGAIFLSALIAQGLIDEFHLFVNPAMIGKGITVFKDLNVKQNLALVQSIGFDCGIAVLHYVTKV